MRLAILACVACSSSIGDGPTPVAGKPGDAAIPVDAAMPEAKPARPVAPGQRLSDVASPLAYDLRLEIDPNSDSFRGQVEIEISLARATDHVWLHADELGITKATYRQGNTLGRLAELPIGNDEDMRGWSFGSPLSGKVTLAFEYTGKITLDEPEGLFRQQAAKQWYVFAQSESVFARRILPCFDEPRWKPTWRVTLIVPPKLVALGNGAVTSETVRSDGKREVVLAPVSGMASYLLSVAVGPFAIVELGKVGRNGVPARVIVPAGKQNRVGVVQQKLAPVVDAIEGYLDLPLPLAKLDLVAVPSFFGAMENTGLITYEESILTGDPKKWWIPRRFIRFTAHELAHQWFGNQVTQVWWDDLWLAEGFSTWLGDKIGDELGAANDPSMRKQLARLHAISSDDEARPLRRPIDDEGVEERFDAIAYEKGGALLEMIEEFVGPEKFREAMRAYVRKHDGGSVTSKDVVAAMATISADAAAVTSTYLDLGGAPVVTLAVDCASKAIQLRAATGTVPVCVRYPEGDKVTRACVAASKDRGTITTPSCPAWVIGNAGGDGYYRIANPALAAKAPGTQAERLTYADDLAAALLRGDVPLATALGELERLAAGDSAGLLGAMLIAQAIDPLVEEALRPAWNRYLTARFGTKMAKRPGAPMGAEGELRGRWWDLKPAAGPGKAWFDKIVARAAKAPDARQAANLEMLGELAPDQAVPIVELALTGTFKPERVLAAIEAMLARPVARDAAWRAVRDRMAKLSTKVAQVAIEEVAVATGSLCDPTSRAEVVATFEDKIPAAKLTRPLASIDRCIARRAKLGDLAAALKRP
jgi:alanyl aminopeptidase